MSTMTPVGRRVIIRPLTEKEERPSGLVIPQNAREPVLRGVVVATGSRRLKDGSEVPLDVGAGDVVRFEGWHGMHITVDSKGYMVMDEDSLIALELEDVDLVGGAS